MGFSFYFFFIFYILEYNNHFSVQFFLLPDGFLFFFCGNFTGKGRVFGQMVSTPFVFVFLVYFDCDKIEGERTKCDLFNNILFLCFFITEGSYGMRQQTLGSLHKV